MADSTIGDSSRRLIESVVQVTGAAFGRGMASGECEPGLAIVIKVRFVKDRRPSLCPVARGAVDVERHLTVRTE